MTAGFRLILGKTGAHRAPLQLFQNISLSANWIWRDVVEVCVMTPADELYWPPEKMTSFGYPKLGWLRILNVSTRSWAFNPSLIGIFLNNDVSTENRPGPRSAPRDTFPKVP